MSDAEDDRGDPPDSGSSLDGTIASPPPAPAAALREDHIQNAVAFLSHPKVRASPVSSKREFLQRKGLSEEEIGEAFRRVPEQPAGAPAVAAAPPAPAAAMQATLQHLQPQATTCLGQPQQSQQQAYGQPQQQQPSVMVLHQAPPPAQQGVRWTQAALGAGFLAASAYAAKSLLWPYMSDAFYSLRGHVRPPPRSRRLNGSGAEEGGDAAAATPAAAAAGEGPEATRAVAEAIQAQTAELRSSIDSIKQLVGTLEASSTSQKAAAAAAADGAAGGGDGGLTVSDLRQELRAFAQTLHEASPSASAAGPTAASAGGQLQVESELGEIKSLLAQILRSPSASRSRSPGRDEVVTPLSVSSAPARHMGAGGSKAAAAAGPADGGLAAAADEEQEQQQHLFATPERAPPPSSTTAAAAAAEGGGGAVAGSLSNGVGGGGSVGSSGAAPTPPPHPASYMEVLEMLEKGQTPPGIRTDINDKPPNPDAAPAEARLKPRPKPWERSSDGGGSFLGSISAAGGSSGSLASLGSAGQPPVPAAPAAAAAGEPPAEQVAVGAQQGLSPVRAPSPAEAEAAAAAASPQQPAQASGGASSFQSPRRAASIFEAVAPPPDSPHIIAGRLSPGGVDTMGRANSSSSSGMPPPPLPGTAVSSSFTALLAAAEERAGSLEGSLQPPEGSGIGRPSSRNWKPPPIPAPTLNTSTSSSSAAAAGGGGGSGGSAPDAPGGSSIAAGAKVPSAASLGDDFASA